MIRWHRTTLVSALTVGLLALAPKARAGEPGEPDAGEAPPAEGEAAAEETPPPPPPPDLGGWGVGGADEEGQFGPKGKTGKLKELDEEKAEEETAGPIELPPPGYVYLDTVLGFGTMDVVTQPGGTDPTSVSTTASFLIGVGYRIGDTWSIGARFPISTGQSNGPLEPYFDGARDPDAYKQIAVGGVELEVKPWFVLSNTVRLPAGLAFVLPTGMGDYAPDPDNRAAIGQAIVNQAASGSRGWEERALFAHKRFGLVPSLGIAFKDGGAEFNAGTKFEIMIRTGGNDPEETKPIDVASARLGGMQQRIRDVALNWWTGAEFYYGFFDGLFTPGARFWMAVGSAGDYRENAPGDTVTDAVGNVTGVPEGSRDYGGVQFAFEPQVKTIVPFTDDKQIGLDARLGYVIPLGSRLGGGDSSFVSGLRIRTGMFF